MGYRKSTPEWKSFLHFLEANDAKAAYIHNMVTMCESGRLDQMRQYRTYTVYFLMNSFKWENSVEGVHYWAALYRAWLRRCKLVARLRIDAKPFFDRSDIQWIESINNLYPYP